MRLNCHQLKIHIYLYIYRWPLYLWLISFWPSNLNCSFVLDKVQFIFPYISIIKTWQLPRASKNNRNKILNLQNNAEYEDISWFIVKFYFFQKGPFPSTDLFNFNGFWLGDVCRLRNSWSLDGVVTWPEFGKLGHRAL